jgi:hypothetical protein
MPLVHIIGVIVAAFAAVAWWDLLGDPDNVRTAYQALGWRGVLLLALVPVGLASVAVLLMSAK